MMKILRVRRSNTIVSLLAVFYFVIGVHVFHPYFHEHEHQTLSSTHWDLSDEKHHEQAIAGEQKDDDHDVCPVCHFLSTIGKTLPGAPLELTSPGAFSLTKVSIPNAFPSLEQKNAFIRGPPLLFSC